MEKPIIYVARDIERALGTEPSPSYFVVANDSVYARSVQEKYPDFVMIVKFPAPLDTFEILEKEETARFIEKVSGQGGKSGGAIDNPAILVFKSTARIEELCAKKGWQLLNPAASLAEKIENKISQVEWLGELAELLPSFTIAPAREIVWQKKPLVLQFAHAHTGQGTILINNEKELREIQKQFPDRPVKSSEFIKGPTFTVNVSVKGETSDIGNPSYQITGMLPLTDSPFATVGNDWSLPYMLLSERLLGELRDIAEKIGAKMRESGWRGLFGIDVVYDEERDQMKLIEINARQPASTTYESQLQSRFRGHGLSGATIFEAHLAALTDSLPDRQAGPLNQKQIEINDGAQIVQRVTKNVQGEALDPLLKVVLGKAAEKKDAWQEKTAELNAAGYATIPYQNTKPNSDFLRIQSNRGLMASHGKWNSRGEKIIEILEK